MGSGVRVGSLVRSGASMGSSDRVEVQRSAFVEGAGCQVVGQVVGECVHISMRSGSKFQTLPHIRRCSSLFKF